VGATLGGVRGGRAAAPFQLACHTGQTYLIIAALSIFVKTFSFIES